MVDFKPAAFGLDIGARATSAAIVDAEAKIVRFYTERGWPLAKMTGREAIIDRADHSMHVTYTLDVGPEAAFGGIATRFRDVPAGKQAQIVGAADVYVSDFGTISIVPNRFQPETSIYLVDKSMAASTYLRPFQSIPMAKTGDADKTLLVVEYALKVRNERAFAHIADCTTT